MDQSGPASLDPWVEELLTHSPVFCVLPWVHICGSVDGVWGRCCVDSTMYHKYAHNPLGPSVGGLDPDALGCTPGSPFASANPDRVRTLLGAFDSPQLRATRRAMLGGEAVPACRYCTERETGGGRSYRQGMNDLFRHRLDWQAVLRSTADDGSYSGEPRFLDIRWSNRCNLRCVMCEYPVSSRWHPGPGLIGPPPVIEAYDDPELWAELKRVAPALERVYVAGGEPMLHAGHRRFLELLTDGGWAGSIDLVYNTNLTVVPEAVITLWRQFRSVEVGASCDGIGATFERIRVGATWQAFTRNLKRVRTVPGVRLRLAVTPQRGNADNLCELVDWAMAEGYELDLTNLLHYPADLSLTSLPENVRMTLARKLSAAADRCRAAGQGRVADELDRIRVFVSQPGRPTRVALPLVGGGS